MEVIVISIGALAKNSLWGEKTPLRTSHATTSLIKTGNELILVDPALPAPALEARLFERTGLKAAAITHVFLTNWRPAHRRALTLFSNARWLMHADEIAAATNALHEAQRYADEAAGSDVQVLADELKLLERVQSAPDELAEDISLFPLPGYSPGQCGLLISLPTSTVLIAGDAVPTSAHFAAGQVFQECFDIRRATDSLAEVYEIADQIIPGHDNIFVNPRTSGI